MKTPLLTYFFTITLLVSIALPTYLTLSETTCEYSLVINDLEDDSEQSEKNNDSDIKIIPHYQENFTYHSFKNSQTIGYKTSQYVTLSLLVDSPPPEYFS